MTADEYREALDALELTQASAAAFLGIAERTSRRFATGEQEVPRSIAALIWLMVDLDVSVDDVNEMLGGDDDPPEPEEMG